LFILDHNFWTPNKKIFFWVQTRRLADPFWGFEQLSSAIGRGAMALVMQLTTAGFGLVSKYEYIISWLSKC